MKEFEESIIQAKRNSFKRQLLYLLLGIIIISFIGIFLFLSRGVSIKINPIEAEKRASVSITKGFSFIMNNKIYSLSKNISILVKSEGYRIYQNNFLLNNNSETIEIILEELPGKVKMRISPFSEKTKIKFNEKFIKNEEIINIDNLNGLYSYTISNPLFTEYTDQIVVELGQSKEIDINLIKEEIPVQILSKPSGAYIYLNNELIGSTPFKDLLLSGEYNLILKKEGYKNLVETIIVSSEEKVFDKNFSLELLPGEIFIKSSEDDSEIYIDNIYSGMGAIRKKMSPGDHTISIMKDGFYTFSKKVLIVSKRINQQKITLEEKIGLVKIISSPVADVLINGKSYGETPLNLSLRSVEQNIELFKEGYRSFFTSLIPNTEFEKKIEIFLKTNTQAKLDEAPLKYKNKVGIEMNLIMPGEFQLGSFKREAGRYSNEVIRNVKLTKPFYISSTLITEDQYNSFLKKSSLNSNKPITSISWYEAAKFCNWLSEQEGLDKVYNFTNNNYTGLNMESNGYRIPTESEWVWAVKFYKQSDIKIFTWGNKMPVKKNVGNLSGEEMKNKNSKYIKGYSDNYKNLSPVKSYQPTNSGLYDITGNTHEWMNDYYELTNFESKNIELNRMGPIFGNGHVIRGSSWRSATLRELRLSFRDKSSKGEDDISFRVARWIGE
jgi:formylglycine-generating enzyme required for sulfatase activity